ncbi:MAG: Ltp family lipoprotein [Brachybacterium sp.]
MDPQGQNQPPYDPSQAQPQNGAPHSAMPSYGGATGQPAPVAPKKRGKGKFIALGCGILALLFILLIGGCAVLFTSGSDSDDAAPAQETTEQEEAPAEDAPAEEVAAEDEVPAEEAPADDVPADFASALTSAEMYSDTMHMSQQGIYAQLTSEFDQFSDEAAQYAIDTIDADWNENALESAKTYSDTLHMSQQGIFDQLTSEFDQFTDEQAQYAIDTIDADWNENALESAKLYQEEMAMSPDAIRDQLTSEYGGKFTAEQADYAIENLNS